MENNAALSLLEKLVAIPSVNPGFADAPDEYKGEERLAGFLMEFGRQNVLETKLFEAKKGRPCVLFSMGPEQAPSVLCSAHMDTVWTPSMESPFKLKKLRTLFHGLGAADDKGSLASALAALLALKPMNLPCRFHVLATCDEEFGLSGIKFMIPAQIRPDAVIVMESTDLNLVTAHKGSCRFQFATRGKGVHSSLVPKGENAIYKAAKLISALEKYSIQMLAEEAHPLLGTNTLSVGTVHGGIQPSFVPDNCSFQVNCRILPGETLETLTSKLKQALSPCGVKYEMTNASFDAFPLETADSIPLVKIFRKTLENMGMDSRTKGVPYAAESSRTSECGIPTVLFGPGSIDYAHTPDEAIDPLDLRKATDVVVSFVKNWGLSKISRVKN